MKLIIKLKMMGECKIAMSWQHHHHPCCGFCTAVAPHKLIAIFYKIATNSDNRTYIKPSLRSFGG